MVLNSLSEYIVRRTKKVYTGYDRPIIIVIMIISE